MDTYTEYTSGVIFLNGESDTVAVYSCVPTETGIFLSGSSTLNVVVSNFVSHGGNVLNGSSTFNVVVSNFVSHGGNVLSGSSDVNFVGSNFVSENGILVNGNTLINCRYETPVEGLGVISSGNSFVQIVWLPTGGTVMSGEVIPKIGFISFGGILISSVMADVTSNVNEPVNGISTGGLHANGNASCNKYRTVSFEAEGEVYTSGKSYYGVTNVKYISTGKVDMYSDTILNFKFNNNLSIIYNINSEIRKSIDFIWNTGKLELSWYRVVGKGSTNACLPNDPCCQKIILNISARSLSELCNQLTRRRYKFPIDFVQRFRIPVNATTNESNSDCNNLIDVQVCDIPDCANFCVNQDVSLRFGFEINVQVNAFFVYESEVNVVNASGSSNVIFVPNYHDLPYTGSGSIELNGSAGYQTNSYTFRGGIKISGISPIQATRWSAIGGEWPNSTGFRFGNTSQSSSTQILEQAWSLTDRVLNEDGLYASTDISYEKTSEILIVRGFNFDLPEWSEVTSIFVSLKRFSTQNNVRDEKIFLSLGPDRISENLAVTNIDWPFINTTKIYGPQGWITDSLDGITEPITKEQLLDPNFGVAIKVMATSSLSATLAKIDSISVNIYYEHPQNSIIRLSSETGGIAKSNSYTSFSVGKVVSSGVANCKIKKRNNINLQSAGVTLSGLFGLPVFEYASGGLKSSGNAVVKPYFETSYGGAEFGGEALVKPYLEVVEGGLQCTGVANRFDVFKYNTSGSIEIYGQAVTPEKKFIYTSIITQPLILYGSAEYKKEHYTWNADGDVILTLGGAFAFPGNIFIPNQVLSFDMEATSFKVLHLKDVDVGAATGATNTIDVCGCLSLSQFIYFKHNFNRDNLFYDFLYRNNFSMPPLSKLKYNKTNNSWQNNFHYTGLGSDGDHVESWNIIFELQCTNNFGSIEIGSPVWKTSIQVFRKNNFMNINSNSRIIIAIIPDVVCAGKTNSLDFLISYNTQTKLSFVSPNSIVYYSDVFDNIGLFSNRSWIDNPNLKLRISYTNPSPTQKMLDLTEVILV